jgi:crotonobetainyl-CoA:carnitine CoA-transferase CaiB-like acyl-CoA transferase
MTTALEGLRVLEISAGMPSAMAGMVLAENGAEVIKSSSRRATLFADNRPSCSGIGARRA